MSHIQYGKLDKMGKRWHIISEGEKVKVNLTMFCKNTIMANIQNRNVGMRPYFYIWPDA